MEISAAAVVGGRPSIPQIGAFVNRQNRQKKISQVWEIFQLTLDADVENRTQERNNEPNHQRQFPRKHDGETADGCYPNQREKPAEKPDQPSSKQERNTEGNNRYQNSNHFILLS